jgi:hypothetical protein
MTAERCWYWIGRLIDPRERNEVAMRMFTSLAFMPDTLVLEEPGLCFFRASNVPLSGCVVIGGARGPDTLDQTTLALQRIEDASTALMHYAKLGRAAQLSVPTNEHYLPLLYALALKDSKDPITYFNDAAPMGSISMRSLRIG